MSQIAKQAEAEQEAEAKTQRRREIVATVRKVFMFVLGASVLGAGIFYRAELQGYFDEKFASSTDVVDSETSEALQSIQANANKRDTALEELTK